MRVDKPRRNQATFSVDPFVDRLCIFFTDELDTISVEDKDTVLDDFMLFAVEADHIAALDECFHCSNLLIRNLPFALVFS